MDTWMSILWGGWLYSGLPLIFGWILDRLLGDPEKMPHPIVLFGKVISFLEHRLNHGSYRLLKGAIVCFVLILIVFLLTWGILGTCAQIPVLRFILQTIGVFYCLAGTTLMREVKNVFRVCDESLEAGRKYVGRIVGRDTGSLSANEVKTAALETLAENMSDGVVAPLFWYMILGLPGIMAYKMINTLDSMVGYRNERYRDFGCVAARTDDVANFIPARLTAFLMVMVSGRLSLLRFVIRYGRCHASPNSGYPEAALAGILGCRFGGTHDYFGKPVEKPYIGSTARELNSADMKKSLRVCRSVEVMMVVLALMTVIIL